MSAEYEVEALDSIVNGLLRLVDSRIQAGT